MRAWQAPSLATARLYRCSSLPALTASQRLAAAHALAAALLPAVAASNSRMHLAWPVSMSRAQAMTSSPSGALASAWIACGRRRRRCERECSWCRTTRERFPPDRSLRATTVAPATATSPQEKAFARVLLSLIGKPTHEGLFGAVAAGSDENLKGFTGDVSGAVP